MTSPMEIMGDKGEEENGMALHDIEKKIDGFMRRKEVEFPDLAVSSRDELRTVKYANELRVRGQLLMTR